METTLVGTNQAKSAGTDTKRPQDSLTISWIKTNTSKNGTGSDPAAADGTGARTDGAQVAFTEARLKTVLNGIWTSGGKPDVIMVGAFNKQAFRPVYRPRNPDRAHDADARSLRLWTRTRATSEP